MPTLRLFSLTVLALLAFAANTIFCRLALGYTEIDAASFTSIRLVSGAATLWLIVIATHKTASLSGSWFSALALFGYAAAFSFAYLTLPVATGALLLFGTVQFTMIVAGFLAGERFNLLQSFGLIIALAGLIYLLSPGIAAPSLEGSVLMIIAGFAWGIYSLHGRGISQPMAVTAGNFIRTVPMTLALSLVMFQHSHLGSLGVLYAVLSGALASGMGYAIWYAVLPSLPATNAATMQLSVPVIAAFGGVLFVGEPITWRLLVASIAILGGIALVLRKYSSR